MSLESVFKLSLIMNMIDNLSGPMAGVASKVGANASKLDAASQTFGGMAKAGAAMQETGSQIVNAVLAPVEATFETRRALGELASLGVQDLEAVENAARSFSDQWAGTSKADFISAAYDIKSGIATLSDEGVAEFTSLAGLTAKATKSTVGEMTSLFATGYGIYKNYYDDMSDIEFGEMFSAGISDAVRAFKTSGSGMAQAIQNLGASATTAQVPLEEQLSVLGMLQATMGGAEAGTKYKAFLRSATKGGEALGLKFTDVNNQLLSMPEILDILRDSYAHTLGIEYMHIHDPEQRSWFQRRVEAPHQPRPRGEHRLLDWAAQSALPLSRGDHDLLALEIDTDRNGSWRSLVLPGATSHKVVSSDPANVYFSPVPVAWQFAPDGSASDCTARTGGLCVINITGTANVSVVGTTGYVQ